MSKSYFNWVREHNHWIGLFGIVFGFVVSMYFYFASKQSGEVSISVNTVKIAQAGVPVLKILDSKGEEVTSDVFGLVAVIWNSGDLSLGKVADRVRVPLTFTLEGDVRIMGAVVQDAKNLDVSDIGISAPIGGTGATVNWREFDPGDAVKVFIVYAGKGQASIHVGARIVGTHIVNTSEYKDVNPNVTGYVDKLFSSLVYDWENHRTKAILNFFSVLAQLSAMGLMLSGKRSSGWVAGLMVVGLLAMFSASGSSWFSKAPF